MLALKYALLGKAAGKEAEDAVEDLRKAIWYINRELEKRSWPIPPRTNATNET